MILCFKIKEQPQFNFKLVITAVQNRLPWPHHTCQSAADILSPLHVTELPQPVCSLFPISAPCITATHSFLIGLLSPIRILLSIVTRLCFWMLYCVCKRYLCVLLLACRCVIVSISTTINAVPLPLLAFVEPDRLEALINSRAIVWVCSMNCAISFTGGCTAITLFYWEAFVHVPLMLAIIASLATPVTSRAQQFHLCLI